MESDSKNSEITAEEILFEESDLTQTPFELFSLWLKFAKESSGFNDPNAMCLGTIDEEGYPDGRMVLLKSHDQNGFVFYTNFLSAKGRSLEKTPRASLTFYWDSIRRQIRIQGEVEKVRETEADNYFSSRPRLSQLGAWASLQSEILSSREVFEDRIAYYNEQFPGIVPRPSHWSGYVIKPQRVEFWQDRRNRLHDRFCYRLLNGTWEINRLYP